MLKNRLIPCVVLKGDLVVQSFGFNNYLPIGKIDAVIEFFVNWDVDEIVVIDIDATKERRTIDLRIVDRVAQKCNVPLTVGGGIANIEFILEILKVGADKICVNTVCFENPEFITLVSQRYGAQFITVAIDAKLVDGKHMAFVRNGQVSTGYTVRDFARRAESLGAGEIFLNSVDRDGSKRGYDIELLKTVSSSVRIPVIACGGVGTSRDLPLAITAGGCSAASAANIFHHTELSTVAGKSIMKRAGIPIRIDSEVSYERYEFDFLGRPI